MASLGVVYAAVLLLGYDKWLTATSKTKHQGLQHLQDQAALAMMLVLLPQAAVVLLAAAVVLFSQH